MQEYFIWIISATYVGVFLAMVLTTYIDKQYQSKHNSQ